MRSEVILEQRTLHQYQRFERRWRGNQVHRGYLGFFEIVNPFKSDDIRDVVEFAQGLPHAYQLNVRVGPTEWEHYTMENLDDFGLVQRIDQLVRSDGKQRNHLEVDMVQEHQHYSRRSILEFAGEGDLLIGYKLYSPWENDHFFTIRGKPGNGAIKALADPACRAPVALPQTHVPLAYPRTLHTV